MTHPKDPANLPVFNAAESAADVGRMLYDALEEVVREARNGAISPAALTNAVEVLARAREEVA